MRETYQYVILNQYAILVIGDLWGLYRNAQQVILMHFTLDIFHVLSLIIFYVVARYSLLLLVNQDHYDFYLQAV